MKSEYKNVVFSLIVSIVFALNLNAGEKGTTGGNFLKIPVSVIPTGLGDAYAAMIGPDSALFNPAGVGLISYNAVSVAYNQYLEGIIQQYVSLLIPTKIGNFAAAYNTLSSGDIKAYDVNDNGIGTTRTSHMWYALTFAKYWPKYGDDRGKLDPMIITPSWTKIPPVTEYRPKVYRLSLGFTLKSMSEELDDISSRTNMVDIGGLLVLPNHWQIGLSAMNSGGKQKFYVQTDDVPMVYRLGVAKDFHTVKDVIVFTFAADLDRYEDDDLAFKFGMEADILRAFQMRFGFRERMDEGSRVTGGFGVNFDRFTSQESLFKGLRLDYAMVNYGDIGLTHRFGMQLVW